MCRTNFALQLPSGSVLSFFALLPARVVAGDAVAVWPLLPVEELAADPAHDRLQKMNEFVVVSTCWTRDEEGIYLAAFLAPPE